MILALTSEAAATGPPPLLFFGLPLAGGALVATLSTIFGAWLNSRREHKRCIRQE